MPKQAEVAEALALGVLTGAYEATRFKSKPATSKLRSADLLLQDGATDSQAGAGAARGAALAKGVLLARCAAQLCLPRGLLGSYLYLGFRVCGDGQGDVWFPDGAALVKGVLLARCAAQPFAHPFQSLCS